MELPKRKNTRLQEYDYATAGGYFITVCTKNHCNLFWENVGATIGRPQDVPLSPYGKIVDVAIQNIPLRYPMITVEHYVIMPNHVHLLLQIRSFDNGRPMVAPTISTVMQQMKGHVTKRIGFPVWQKLFHDHIIRDETDYLEIWQYIDNNPAKWQEDRFYCK